MVAATELITLARMKRGTHLLQHPEKQVIAATNVSLEEGKSTEDIETVRKANAIARGQQHIPLIEMCICTNPTKDALSNSMCGTCAKPLRTESLLRELKPINSGNPRAG